MAGGVEGFDQVAKQDKAGGGVEKRVVPRFFGNEGTDLVAEAELVADAAERVVCEVGPCGAGQQEGIDPWTKAVTRKSTQKALFGAFSVSDYDRADEVFFQLWPKRK
jgi:hypothetical protein